MLRSFYALIRAAALDSSRALPTDEFNPVFLQALSDPEPSVRGAASYALGQRRLYKPGIPIEIKTLENEPDESVWRLLMNSVWRNCDTHPKVLKIFKVVPQSDPSDDL